MTNNIVPQAYKISKQERNKKNEHNSFLIFFTGLSGSGKSTLANILEQRLFKEGINTYVLDGDNIRQGINNDLSFTPEDRTENIRRIAEISKLFIDAGVIVLATFVSPYKKDREFIRKTVGTDTFVEVFVNTSIEECEKRDVKGLYKKVREGKIENMTGISAPYEVPETPEVEIRTDTKTVEESVDLLYDAIKGKIGLK
ncbi:adenylyl-sulfate kinase [Leptobacterium sp. I13]|uniref:adenylyl-sulfate kinase n=1 Tax=Leptobacterium meishanense TaxID=3128904 RepID=UPI0030EE6040